MNVIRIFAVCVVAGGLLAGCSSKYLVDRPVVLATCEPGKDARQRSTAALIKALEGRRWTIEGADLEAGLVRAKACRGGDYCISIDAAVDLEGEIRIVRTPRQYISRKGGKMLKRWVANLERTYNHNRCLPPDVLQKVLGKGYPRYEPLEEEKPEAAAPESKKSPKDL